MVEMSKEGYVSTLGPGPGRLPDGAVDAAGTHRTALSAQGRDLDPVPLAVSAWGR